MDDDESLLNYSQRPEDFAAPLLDEDQSSHRSAPMLRVRALRVVIDDERYVDVALLENADALAMHAAVTAALKHVLLDGNSWWLVDGSSEMIVPLCAALPDGCQLWLRTSSGKVKGPRTGRGQTVRSLGPPSSNPSLNLGPPLVIRKSQENMSFLNFSERNIITETEQLEQQQKVDADESTPDDEAKTQLLLSQAQTAARNRPVPSGEGNTPPTTESQTSRDLAGNGGGGNFRGSFFNLSNALSKRGREPDVDASFVDFDRMTKLSTDLANERTLLAWCRTALAVERTVFSFLSFKDSKGPTVMRHIYYIATGALATYAVFVGIIGVERFYKIKNVIQKKEPPAYYFRFSVQPAIVILGVILAVVCVSIYGHFIARA